MSLSSKESCNTPKANSCGSMQLDTSTTTSTTNSSRNSNNSESKDSIAVSVQEKMAVVGTGRKGWSTSDAKMATLCENSLGLFARLIRSGFTFPDQHMKVLNTVLEKMHSYQSQAMLQTFGSVSILSLYTSLSSEEKKQLLVNAKALGETMTTAFVKGCERADEHVVSIYIKVFGVCVNTRYNFVGGQAPPLIFAVRSGFVYLTNVFLKCNAKLPAPAIEKTLVHSAITNIHNKDQQYRQLQCLALLRERRNSSSNNSGNNSDEDEEHTSMNQLESASKSLLPTFAKTRKHTGEVRDIRGGEVVVVQEENQGEGEQSTLYWFIDALDNLLLSAVFDIETGNIIVWRAVLFILCISLLTGLCVGVILTSFQYNTFSDGGMCFDEGNGNF
eukprot:m.106803 g.106803  ORF g.106803 m.106803 type:complete len:388 (-) comp12682_c0_seq1:27-1190(-)